MRWPAEPFWNYSVQLYARRGVEAACLELQRRHGLDVNLLLLACWLGSRGIELDRATVARAERTLESWRREVIGPMRRLRDRLKAALVARAPGSIAEGWPEEVAALRERVLAAEIDGEHLEQLALAHVVKALPVRAAARAPLAGANLRACWSFQAEDRDALRTILGAAFPSGSSVELEASLDWLDE